MEACRQARGMQGCRREGLSEQGGGRASVRARDPSSPWAPLAAGTGGQGLGGSLRGSGSGFLHGAFPELTGPHITTCLPALGGGVGGDPECRGDGEGTGERAISTSRAWNALWGCGASPQWPELVKAPSALSPWPGRRWGQVWFPAGCCLHFRRLTGTGGLTPPPIMIEVATDLGAPPFLPGLCLCQR